MYISAQVTPDMKTVMVWERTEWQGIEILPCPLTIFMSATKKVNTKMFMETDFAR